MARCTTHYNGKYTQPDCSKKVRPYAGLFLLIVALLAGTCLIRQNSKTVYELPGAEIPILTVPTVDPVIGEPESADDLVATGYTFTVRANNVTFEVSCPVIRADFGKEINEYIIDELNHVLYCIQHAVDHGECLPVTALSYQAYYARDVLTLVLLETLQGDEQRNLASTYNHISRLYDMMNEPRETAKARFNALKHSMSLHGVDLLAYATELKEVAKKLALHCDFRLAVSAQLLSLRCLIDSDDPTYDQIRESVIILEQYERNIV